MSTRRTILAVLVLNRFVRWLVLCAVAFAAIGPANAKVVVDQVYSNANGSIQFIVFRVEDAFGCGVVFSVSAFTTGSTVGGWVVYAAGWMDSGTFWSPRTASTSRHRHAPDYRSRGWLSRDRCGGHPILRGLNSAMHRSRSTASWRSTVLASPVPNVATNYAGFSGSVTAAQAASAGLDSIPPAAGLTGTWYEPRPAAEAS